MRISEIDQFEKRNGYIFSSHFLKSKQYFRKWNLQYFDGKLFYFVKYANKLFEKSLSIVTYLAHQIMYLMTIIQKKQNLGRLLYQQDCSCMLLGVTWVSLTLFSVQNTWLAEIKVFIGMKRWRTCDLICILSCVGYLKHNFLRHNINAVFEY